MIYELTSFDYVCHMYRFPGISILREKKSCVKQMIVDRQKANGILTCVNQEEIKVFQLGVCMSLV